jgi:membrane-associated phospholipid phosphatase
VTSSTREGAPAQPQPFARLRWWREILYCLAYYFAYTLVRDLRGTRPVSRDLAYANAERIIHFEQFFGLFQERRIQSWFLSYHLVIRFLDDFYGSAHFIATLGVLVFLFWRQPWRYAFWRNMLGIITGLALVGFLFFPLMPPRLLPASYGFVDTLRTIGGLWSFNSGPMNAVSNQYAAMPSLHFAWALWVTLALRPCLRTRWARELLWLYPAATLITIVVTGNHYLADAVGGALIAAMGYGGARLAATVTGRHTPAT